ncbi:MAG TPA: helix-turn-helix transcriptional regulator [Candidatus Faecisoma merdavium]|mgnify:CR=1 FL=1|nr:helix-turn-helix transcriptional regulator [Candidatus Faecisoma merdavium]
MNLKLKEARIKKGYTAKYMAEQLNISKPFYSQLENDRRTLSYIMAIKIADILKTKPDKLFYDDFKERMK